MKLHWEKFQAAYASSKPELQLLIDGDKIPLCANNLIGRHNLKIAKADLIVLAVNKILNLETDEVLIEYLSQYTEDKTTAAKVINELYVCAVGSEPTPASTKSTAFVPPPPPEPQPEVPKLRTMASDSVQVGYASSEEPTHTSSQDSVLGR